MEQAPETGDRLLDKTAMPDDATVREWIGTDAFAHWTALRDWIENSYPGTFAPEWLYGGRKHGWSLRYKKSRAFCSLIPEYRRLSVMVILGAAEREKYEARRDSFSSRLNDLYDRTRTYHDGKWLRVEVSGDDDLQELTELLAIKRPRRHKP